MPKIELLDQITIDKIAAGEVVERPASVVKELVENAIDAGASRIAVEIEEGGIASIRISDNGSGIEREDIPKAFLRHSTSKIRNVDDLTTIHSLGFRGEALSSISAVAKVELVTKTKENPLGCRFTMDGGIPGTIEDAGATDGTVFSIRQLFFNTPARRKFLKTAMTEASHVNDAMIHLALSHPEIAFSFKNQNQEKLRTSGNGKLKDTIYQIYGRDVANALIPISFEKPGFTIQGFIGKPELSRGNRNYETFFVNGRYVKSGMISKSIEDAYKGYTMQHKFPFVVFELNIDTQAVDVNVHPTKMEVRFDNQQKVYNSIYEGIDRALKQDSLIPVVEFPDPKPEPKTVLKPEPKLESPLVSKLEPRPEPAEKISVSSISQASDSRPVQAKKEKEVIPSDTVENLNYFMEKMKERVQSYHDRNSQAEVSDRTNLYKPKQSVQKIRETVSPFVLKKPEEPPVIPKEPEKKEEKQLDLFQEHYIEKTGKQAFTLIGQVFDTYWLVQKEDELYIIDQHAAHEKVLYERTVKEMKNHDFTTQYVSPPLVLNLSMHEYELLEQNVETFTSIGFELEPFGESAYAVRGVPANLFSLVKQDLFLELLDQLGDELKPADAPAMITDKIASLSCKAAVKGNMKLSFSEMEHLIEELLKLDNPYHCPHGRPTIIAFTKKELEKKFKRIVS